MFETNHKGAVAEAKIAAEAIALGIPVLKPVAEHGRYDIAFELGDQILRIQCKWGNVKDDLITAQVGGCWHSPTRGYVRTTYDKSEIDAFAIYAGELDRCYLLAVDLVDGQSVFSLRLEAPKNNQRGAINWAADHELGAVAQLAERYRGTVEARGSNPLSSTRFQQTSDRRCAQQGTVGAHQFRNLFGWYMQRAAAGEEFLVTRRGKPFARLSPPEAQLPVRSPIRLPLVSADELVRARREGVAPEEGGESAAAAA